MTILARLKARYRHRRALWLWRTVYRSLQPWMRDELLTDQQAMRERHAIYHYAAELLYGKQSRVHGWLCSARGHDWKPWNEHPRFVNNQDVRFCRRCGIKQRRTHR